MNIDKILSSKEPEYYFDVESFYTEEQERLYRLRNEVVDRSEGFRVLENNKEIIVILSVQVKGFTIIILLG
jgi:hypothetical protein